MLTEKQKQNQRRFRLRHIKRMKAKDRKRYWDNLVYEKARNRKYHQENKKKVNSRVRLYRHDMTQDEHDARLKKQRNRCAICRKKFRKTSHIDHNHKTGRNRGLLCADCNLGLGRFKDSVRILKQAIKYVLKD